jgi:plasmid stabilization system protein ParE
LEEILFQIRVIDGRPLTARRNGEEIQESVNERAAKHILGQVHPAAPDGWFYFRCKRWLIFYRPLSDGIEVMRIIDAARDLPKHLGDKEP